MGDGWWVLAERSGVEWSGEEWGMLGGWKVGKLGGREGGREDVDDAGGGRGRHMSNTGRGSGGGEGGGSLIGRLADLVVLKGGRDGRGGCGHGWERRCLRGRRALWARCAGGMGGFVRRGVDEGGRDGGYGMGILAFGNAVVVGRFGVISLPSLFSWCFSFLFFFYLAETNSS